ncbi:uncharacterized protein K452DRAFT_313887 [Aplosporella prunicola CBS 121167]|uniref:Heme peroxidase n=1 Tax=Aplosporella prunicola CBS 121167 TaxID=1176127 RepID=A0A6A6AUG6_9PEZI|nr:uncharacterized protein K452DRAFT_313887 [Aplosporella prunicola CBS 121167]KAF2135579.1 hypothetical protein K452DRAFT_313887 [Aplosporella prunicola CBS 121167]
MYWITFVFLVQVLYVGSILAVPIWPTSIDELEDIMFLNTGYRARGFAKAVTPCSAGAGAGRVAAAEFVRTAFHDMANANVYFHTGGLDASIAYETNRLENVGQAFTTTLATYEPFLTSRSSMADIISMGVYTAVRSCGGPVISVRTGRIDAKAAGTSGQVPLPQNAIGIFISQFERIGFNQTEMISLVACGHTLGGVHAGNFPEVVPVGTAADEFAQFDTGDAFDTNVVKEYLSSSTANPLVIGPSTTNGRNSDARVFASDGNVTITAMVDPETFQSVCASMLQRMIDVVPTGVALTDPITPYEVKPNDLRLALISGGDTISFTGEIRVRTTSRSVSSVQLVYKDRDGGNDCGSCLISTELKGNAAGFDDSFAFYGFSAEILSSSSISAFDVELTLSSGETEAFNNGGDSFPVQDEVLLQHSQSCLSTDSSLHVVAAVRNSVSATVNLDLTLKVPASGSVIPVLQAETVTMEKVSTIGPYDLYTASYALDPTFSKSTRFGITAGSSVDSFNSAGDLLSICSDSEPEPPTSSMSTSTSSLISSTTSAISTLVSSSTSQTSSEEVPSPTSTAYSYEGCYTDSVSSRTFNDAVFYDSNMTISKCSEQCTKWAYFGVEYGEECYCGAIFASSSTKASESECNLPCPGNSVEKCGAGDRLSAYKNLLLVDVTNPVIPGYAYQGCYNDSASDRVLVGSSTQADSLTVEGCASFCNAAAYFGVEYGRECYCGSELKASAVKQAEGDCSIMCAGDTAEYCGAADRIGVYRKEGSD